MSYKDSKDFLQFICDNYPEFTLTGTFDPKAEFEYKNLKLCTISEYHSSKNDFPAYTIDAYLETYSYPFIINKESKNQCSEDDIIDYLDKLIPTYNNLIKYLESDQYKEDIKFLQDYRFTQYKRSKSQFELDIFGEGRRALPLVSVRIYMPGFDKFAMYSKFMLITSADGKVTEITGDTLQEVIEQIVS